MIVEPVAGPPLEAPPDAAVEPPVVDLPLLEHAVSTRPAATTIATVNPIAAELSDMRPSALPGLIDARPLTHIEALELDDLPRHLIVLGHGACGGVKPDTNRMRSLLPGMADRIVVQTRVMLNLHYGWLKWRRPALPSGEFRLWRLN